MGAQIIMYPYYQPLEVPVVICILEDGISGLEVVAFGE